MSIGRAQERPRRLLEAKRVEMPPRINAVPPAEAIASRGKEEEEGGGGRRGERGRFGNGWLGCGRRATRDCDGTRTIPHSADNVRRHGLGLPAGGSRVQAAQRSGGTRAWAACYIVL